MKKLLITLIATTLLITSFGQNNDTTSSFQPTLEFMQQLLFSNISKLQFEKLNPSAHYLNVDKLADYNDATGKHDLSFYRYYFSSEFRNTPIEIRIEAVDENSPIRKVQVKIEGAYWSGAIKEGEIKSDIYSQAAKGNFISKGATKWGNGMKELMRNDKVTVDLFYNLVNPKVVYEMWKHD